MLLLPETVDLSFAGKGWCCEEGAAVAAVAGSIRSPGSAQEAKGCITSELESSLEIDHVLLIVTSTT